MSIAGLHHVAIPYPVGADAKALAFYGGILGLTKLDKPAGLQRDGGLWFGLADGRQIHLQADPQFTPLTRPHPAFACEDIEAIAAKLAEAGHSPRWDERWDGVKRFFTHDPFGNRLEFVRAQAVGL